MKGIYKIIYSATLLCVFLAFLPVLMSCQKNIKNDISSINDHQSYQESQTISEETPSGGEDSQSYPEVAETVLDSEKEAATKEEEILKYKPNELGQVMI